MRERYVDIVNDEKAILDIATRTRKDLERKGIDVGNNPKLIATIVASFMDNLVNVLGAASTVDADVEIDLFGYYKLGVSHSMFLRDENRGNSVPYIKKGEKVEKELGGRETRLIMEPKAAFKMAIKNDNMTSEHYEDLR